MKASDCLQHISKTSDFHIDLSSRELKLEFDKIFFILNICVKLQQNRSINVGARAMTMFFSENSHCDLDLGPRTLKLKIHQDIVILHICGKLNQNRSIYEGSRAMTMFFSKNSH